jgi:hypothetical protein
LRRATLVLLLLSVTPGLACASLDRLLGFRHQAEQVRRWARVEGRIETEGPSEGTLVVLLARAGEPPTGVDSYVRVRPGSFAFPVAPGRYLVGAYEDRNRNGLLDPGERARSVEASPLLEVGPGERVAHDIRLGAADATPADAAPVDVLGLTERSPDEQAEFSLWALSAQGELCEDLAAPRFGPAAGTRGLWQMTDFVNDGVAGIWFLEPYDPARVPVLFVHGIAGSPQQFAALMAGLDRERFQAWFYFYPSGFPLSHLARHLATLLKRLQVQHDAGELAIVAHSMGGLVARGAILGYFEETHRDDVRLFVTLSTPWGGEPRAEGSDRAPIELPPAFLDMRPSSDYLRWLFHADGAARRLPPGAEFHLLFGFRMRGRGRVADDGTVTVASQLRPEAQAQALTLRGLDQGHVEILESREALDRLNLLLSQRFD